MESVKLHFWIYFKLMEIAFWRYRWLMFFVFILIGFWAVYATAVLMSSVWKFAFIATFCGTFGIAPLVYSCRIEDLDDSDREKNLNQLRSEIKELKETKERT